MLPAELHNQAPIHVLVGDNSQFTAISWLRRSSAIPACVLWVPRRVRRSSWRLLPSIDPTL